MQLVPRAEHQTRKYKFGVFDPIHSTINPFLLDIPNRKITCGTTLARLPPSPIFIDK